MSTFFVKQLHTLDTFSFAFTELNKEWGCDKRYGVDALQRFLLINRRALDYLNVKAEIEMAGNNPCLKLQTSHYAGCVPMMSPKDGEPCGDLCVGGRFGEDLSELLSIIGDSLLPEYADALPPLASSMLEPPLYFECCNFIDSFLKVEKASWHKFDVVSKAECKPSGGTRWDVYAQYSYDPSKALSYPNRTNTLSPFHKEFLQMLALLNICFDELKKPRTPIRSRISYKTKIDRLRSKYNGLKLAELPAAFIEHASDPLPVKEAKRIANTILQNKRTYMHAWRIDYSEFFERYVQYVFGEAAKSCGMRPYSNLHYSITGMRPRWSLHYLEPDLIVQQGDIQYVLDAKYKSHMFNVNENSDDLKDSFRHDLHQILAYCSFNTMTAKKAMLVYPFNDFTCRELHITTPLARAGAVVYLVGIPLSKGKMEDLREKICNLL